MESAGSPCEKIFSRFPKRSSCLPVVILLSNDATYGSTPEGFRIAVFLKTAIQGSLTVLVQEDSHHCAIRHIVVVN
jgi:hypothetical protein